MSNLDDDVYYKALEIGTILIAGCGAFTNSLSLSYFIFRDNRGLNNRLIMLLNSFDLAVCLTACITTLLWLYAIIYNDGIEEEHRISLRSLNMLYKLSLEGTAFATCLLSVTRALSLYRPFYQISGKGVVIAVVIFTTGLVVKYATFAIFQGRNAVKYYTINLGLLVADLTLIIGIVAISNIFTIFKLLKRNGGNASLPENNKQVTITIVILSVLFCVFNLVYVAYLGLWFYCLTTGNTKALDSLPNFLHGVAYVLVVPLNSAVNPAVYFMLNQSMRGYVVRIKYYLCCKTERNGSPEYTPVEETSILQDTNL